MLNIHALMSCFISLGLFIIASNAFVCYVIAVHKVIKGVLRFYLLSLAITDLLVGVVCIPIYLSREWLFAHRTPSVYVPWITLHSILVVAESLLATSSILHLCIMAFDRCMSVSYPFYHRLKLRRKRTAMKMLLIPWLLAPFNALLCFATDTVGWAILVGVTIMLPSCFITSCYAILFHKLRKRNRIFSGTTGVEQVKEKQMVMTLLTLIIVFAICWLPLFIIGIYLSVNKTHPTNTRFLLSVSLFFQYFNSACNPIIYAAFNPAFRLYANNILVRFRSNSSFTATRKSNDLSTNEAYTTDGNRKVTQF